MEIAAALLTVTAAAFGWAIRLAWDAGRILQRVEVRLSNHEQRIATLEIDRPRQSPEDGRRSIVST